MSANELHEAFFSKLINEKAAVTIFLVNGVKLQGVIESFDSSGVILEHKKHRQFVFRHAISTIMPSMNNNTAHNQTFDN